MKKTIKALIELSPSDAEAIRMAIDGGDYNSQSEVIDSALTLWKQLRQGTDKQSTEFSRLHTLYEEGLASGPAMEFDLEALRSEVQREIRESKD